MSEPRVRVRNVSKSFGGIDALKDVSFDIQAGQIHALVGENGAGKSTLVKIITGLQEADRGAILLDGAEIRFHNPMEARASGGLAVYQDPKLFPNLDIAENVFMGIHPKTRPGRLRLGPIQGYPKAGRAAHLEAVRRAQVGAEAVELP